jgi:hypothetical protein
MKNMQGIVIALWILAGGWTCSAQSSPVPFGQLERDAQSLTQTVLAPTNVGSNFLWGVAPVPESVARSLPSPPPASHRTLSKGYLFVNGLHVGTAMLDVALTRHCIANHTCREANPLMPSSAGGQVSVDSALVGYISWFSYEMKKHQSRSWWCAPMIGSAAQAVRTEIGMAHFRGPSAVYNQQDTGIPSRVTAAPLSHSPEGPRHKVPTGYASFTAQPITNPTATPTASERMTDSMG